jgi:hypothetical protein
MFCSRSKVIDPLKLDIRNLIFEKLNDKDAAYFKEYQKE